MKGRKPSQPSGEEIARIRYLVATILRCSLRYYYTDFEPEEPPTDEVFDALEHELDIFYTIYPRYSRPYTTDRGAGKFMEWLIANPDKKLGPMEVSPDPTLLRDGRYCG